MTSYDLSMSNSSRKQTTQATPTRPQSTPLRSPAPGRRPRSAELRSDAPVQRKATSSVAAPTETATSNKSAANTDWGSVFRPDLSSEAPASAAAAPRVSSGGSNGLPTAVQAKMESAFNTDFSNVNIHKSSNKASSIGALAYTQGNDMHFAPGQYDPGSQSGQELIGHELAHVVQQRQGRVSPTKRLGKMEVNDSDALEREADAQGALAAQGKSVNSGAPIAAGGAAGPAQLKADSSFPEGLTEEDLLGKKKKKKPGAGGGGEAEGGAPAQMKVGPAVVQLMADPGVVQMMSAPGDGVIQMRGGAKVGRLCVVTNVVSQGLTAGHAWLSYTPTGGGETTYGTWGNRDPIGLHRNLEVGKAYAARRCTDVDAADVTQLDSYASANNAWGYVNNCASFAARGWLSVTGESLSYTSMGIPNPSALGAGISAAGGELAVDDGGGSSASSGSSYGSSSLGSAKPGSSGDSSSL